MDSGTPPASSDPVGPAVDPMLRARVKAQMFPTLAQPASIGRFVISGELGRGGMGVVYAAFDPELHRPVAVKVLARDSGASEIHERMRTEARAMAQLSHPNVVQIHEVGEHDDRLYIAMEFVEGEDLHQWLKSERPYLWELLEVFIGAGRGLAAAHAKGLVHRDFKPANVMISRDGDAPRVRVTDFGLARSEMAPTAEVSMLGTTLRQPAAVIGGGHTREGDLLGTPVYMSPEQLRGQPVTAKSDQFAFCVSLFEALHGVRPFQGDTIADLSAHVLTGKRVEVDASRVPAWLQEIVERGLSPKPDDRWPSMSELLEAIDTGRRERGLGQLAEPKASRDYARFIYLLVGGAVVGGIVGASLESVSGRGIDLTVLLTPVVSACVAALLSLSVIYVFLGVLKRGSLAMFESLPDEESFECSVPPATAMQLVIRGAAQHGYLVDDLSAREHALCLRTRFSLWSLGAFVRVRFQPGPPSRVCIGRRPVTTRWIDWLWRSSTKQSIAAIRGLLGGPERFPPKDT